MYIFNLLRRRPQWRCAGCGATKRAARLPQGWSAWAPDTLGARAFNLCGPCTDGRLHLPPQRHRHTLLIWAAALLVALLLAGAAAAKGSGHSKPAAPPDVHTLGTKAAPTAGACFVYINENTAVNATLITSAQVDTDREPRACFTLLGRSGWVCAGGFPDRAAALRWQSAKLAEAQGCARGAPQ